MRYQISKAAQADILQILSWTQRRFGMHARKRYQRLMVAALRDLASDPCRPGSANRPELGERARSWHLRLSSTQARGKQANVQHPRHFIIYRPLSEGGVAVARILHDAMDIPQQMEQGDPWQMPEDII